MHGLGKDVGGEREGADGVEHLAGRAQVIDVAESEATLRSPRLSLLAVKMLDD